ncbi:hypothetical protein HKX48_001013 [Thoreauomyces humboldtii]|nr:hypothetical protein HKX48_001013 [Thoreauomyces humboldtii]
MVVKIVKSVLQVLALTAVLLTWSSVGRIFETLTTKTNSLHVWFGAPTAPKVIHVGEIYNLTIEWTAVLATRKTYLNTSVDLGLWCSGGNGVGPRYQFDKFLVQSKSGQVYVDYPLTAADLLPSASGALCHFTMLYSYQPNVLAPGAVDLVLEDTTQSAVFKLIRAPRVGPLPLADASFLEPADRRLSWQLRKNPDYAALSDGTLALPTRLSLIEPRFRRHQYTAVSMWPEDDPEWVLEDALSLFDAWKWIIILFLVYAVRTSDQIRTFLGTPWRKLVSWWGNDIERTTY